MLIKNLHKKADALFKNYLNYAEKKRALLYGQSDNIKRVHVRVRNFSTAGVSLAYASCQCQWC